jgi:HEAT repeat protein
MPLVLIDSVPRWDILQRVARDSTRVTRYRRRAADLLARGAANTIAQEPNVDDDTRTTRREAVYAIARQQPRNADVIPDLLAIAKSNPHRDARVAALYQLGQMADARAVDLFTTMLRGQP